MWYSLSALAFFDLLNMSNYDTVSLSWAGGSIREDHRMANRKSFHGTV